MEGKGLVGQNYNSATPLTVDFRTIDLVGGEMPKTFFGGFRNPIGIEIEVEGVSMTDKTHLLSSTQLWKIVDDGSLKDYGTEFVSVPLAGRAIDKALADVQAWFAKYSHKFSHRCSIHVHQNINDISFEKLNYLLSYYTVLEEALFSYCDPLRRCSPFCVPITDTSPAAFRSLDDIHPGHKYLAFNLAPISKQNTVEYRHLEGTDDLRKVRRWVQILCKLHRYVVLADKDRFDQDLDMFERGDVAPLEKMLGVHFNLFERNQINDSVAKGYGWLAARGVF